MAGFESLYPFAAHLGAEIGSMYRDNYYDRSCLMEFMDANDWFGEEYIIRDKEPRMPAAALTGICGSLSLWLTAYRKPGSEKLEILLEHFKGQYPQTCLLYRKFVSDRKLADAASALTLLDFLFCEIDREITEYSEVDLEKLVRLLDIGATRAAAKVFADFLCTEKQDGEPLSRWTYTFSARDSPELINAAYPLSDFAAMAYCVFNEEMWEQQDMVKKAVGNKSYADLWLFAALHFICALRIGDMASLPAPALPFSGKSVLESVAAGTFTKQESAALADELAIRLRLKPMKPSKTSAYERTPDLKLFVPESLRAPLGMIIAIVLAHHPEICAGDGFVKPDITMASIRNFFGNHFVKALGNRRLSSRRCNKSYLQGIAAVADDTPGKPKGYMIAALARSHKSGIGRLPEMTDIYLKDAKFTGYSPEFIIAQMFERGVFSFIPAVLLEIYAGTAYTQLPITAQTGLIVELGLTATQVERVAVAMEQAMDRSRNAVFAVLKDPHAIKENAYGLIQNIASGYARGKQDGYLCLMAAAGYPCAFAGRDGCIGCDYEIYTKAAIHMLMKEYARLVRIKNSAPPDEAWRYGQIMEKALLPAVAEMLCAMQLLYPKADMGDLLDIIEEGLNLADGDTGGSKRELQPFDGCT